MAVMIGKIIHDLVKKHGIKAKFVAGYINVSESTLFGIYKRESVDIDKLILFSRLFNTNLFVHYLNEEPLKSMVSKETAEYEKRISELENEASLKAIKLNDLQEIIKAQKKVISLYEKNSKQD